jgi:hypothetical protein
MPRESKTRITIIVLVAAALAVGAVLGHWWAAPRTSRLRLAISFPAEQSDQPLDGRVILVVSNNDRQEPRFENDVYEPDTQPAFGIDVEGLAPGQEAIIDANTFGYPLKSLGELPPGDYWVQAVLHRYETFHRSDGHVVKLPMDRGEGQHWNRAPGNLYNAPVKVHLDPRTSDVVHLSLDQVIPPFQAPQDTRYIKYVSIQSDLLTKFWGRPMRLGAIVLLPEGASWRPPSVRTTSTRRGPGRTSHA